jgi:hypothetical protein
MDALVGALKARPTAGHGVHHPILSRAVGTALCGRPSVPLQGRPRGGAPTPEPNIGVYQRSSAVSNPSSAGHGLHSSFPQSRPSPRAWRLLAGAAPLAAFSAGRGMLRSFSSAPAIVPTGTP